MCGFAGYISKTIQADKTIASQMSEKLFPRGPDSRGVWCDEDSGYAVGHQRLSILDLNKTGDQPMLSFNGRYVLAFNGEIFNHLQIRNLLDAEQKIPWKGTSDTESLNSAFVCWGLEKTLNNINGMFAFALWDREKRVLTLARDRLGEKPLYYGYQGRSFVFGSQLKALSQHPEWEGKINNIALESYLKYGYISSPLSIFESIFKLEAGEYMQVSGVNLDILKQKKYWDIQKIIRTKKDRILEPSLADMKVQLEEKLMSSVQKRMLSDVPLGAFLSGGIDSSLIASLMQSQSSLPIQTFTIGFDSQLFNEAGKATKVARYLGTNHNEIMFSERELIDLISDLGGVWDEPFSDTSQLPTLLLSRVTKDHVSVALSGDGGDEIFCGYNRYNKGYDWYKRIKNLTFNQSLDFLNTTNPFLLNAISSISFGKVQSEQVEKLINSIKAQSLSEYYSNVVQIFDDNDDILIQRKNIEKEYEFELLQDKRLSDEEKLMYLDVLFYLPDDILTKVDRSSMSVGLEARAPFLDHDLVEWSLNVPISFKKRNGKGKWILRQLLRNYLPGSIIDSEKKGFSVPLEDWLKGPLKDWAKNLLHEEGSNPHSIFNPQRIDNLLSDDFYEFRKYQKIWTLAMYLSWKKSFPN